MRLGSSSCGNTRVGNENVALTHTRSAFLCPRAACPVGAAGGFHWLVPSSSLSSGAEISGGEHLIILFGACLIAKQSCTSVLPALHAALGAARGRLARGRQAGRQAFERKTNTKSKRMPCGAVRRRLHGQFQRRRASRRPVHQCLTLPAPLHCGGAGPRCVHSVLFTLLLVA